MTQEPLGKTMETCPAKGGICRAAEVKTPWIVCEDRKKTSLESGAMWLLKVGWIDLVDRKDELGINSKLRGH